jgi:hypothetical protein
MFSIQLRIELRGSFRGVGDAFFRESATLGEQTVVTD